MKQFAFFDARLWRFAVDDVRSHDERVRLVAQIEKHAWWDAPSQTWQTIREDIDVHAALQLRQDLRDQFAEFGAAEGATIGQLFPTQTRKFGLCERP